MADEPVPGLQRPGRVTQSLAGLHHYPMMRHRPWRRVESGGWRGSAAARKKREEEEEGSEARHAGNLCLARVQAVRPVCRASNCRGSLLRNESLADTGSIKREGQ